MNNAGILIAILIAAAGGILLVLGLAYQPPEPGSAKPVRAKRTTPRFSRQQQMWGYRIP